MWKATLALAMLGAPRSCYGFVTKVGSEAWRAARGRVRARVSVPPASLDTCVHETRQRRRTHGASRMQVAEGEAAKPYYITTPIYYVNDKPHVGHAYTTLACDVIARFMRLDGREVFFLTGTDEHGQKVEQSAAKQGKSPLQFCDEVSQNFKDLLNLMNFSADRFIRTTEEAHMAAAQALWEKLVASGNIYLGTYAGWYSVRDESFYTEGELVDGKAPTGAEVEWVEKEPSYFFRLSAWQEPLLELYREHPDFVGPPGRLNEVVSFVSGGLRDLSVSRTAFRWGVPVPGDDSHVMYVWVDALTNYLSALGYPDDSPGSSLQRLWPADLHVVGKDILRFHAVYWPALLMAAGLQPPRRLFAHGWWTRDGQKMSKSVGNVVCPTALVERYGTDATRYFLMAEVPFGNDGDFSEAAVATRVNSQLANGAGNAFQRTLAMCVKNCGGAVPEPGPLQQEDEALLAVAGAALGEMRAVVATQQLHRACEVLQETVRAVNKYLDEMAPWSLKKTDPARMRTVLWTVLEALRHVAVLYQPLVPASAARLLDQMGVAPDQRSFAALLDPNCVMRPGAPLIKPEPVFPRVEDVVAAT